MHDQMQRLRRVTAVLEGDLQRPPTIEEIAEAGAWSVAEVKRIQNLKRTLDRTVSVDSPIGEEDNSTLGDVIVDVDTNTEEQAGRTLMANQLEQVIDTLPHREAMIIRERMGLVDGEPKTLDFIGQVWGVSRERIRQIEKLALTKMAHPSRSAHLPDSLSINE